MVVAKRTWLDALDACAVILSHQPPQELSALHWSDATQQFEDPTAHPGAVPHSGRLGRIVPVVPDTA